MDQADDEKAINTGTSASGEIAVIRARRGVRGRGCSVALFCSPDGPNRHARGLRCCSDRHRRVRACRLRASSPAACGYGRPPGQRARTVAFDARHLEDRWYVLQVRMTEQGAQGPDTDPASSP